MLDDSNLNEGAPTLEARFSRNVAARRNALGITQAQLAERVGVDTETVSRFERGKHLPSLKTLERLAGELTTTIADLLAEQPVGADDDALIITAWLSNLPDADRQFAKEMLKGLCDHLARR